MVCLLVCTSARLVRRQKPFIFRKNKGLSPVPNLRSLLSSREGGALKCLLCLDVLSTCWRAYTWSWDEEKGKVHSKVQPSGDCLAFSLQTQTLHTHWPKLQAGYGTTPQQSPLPRNRESILALTSDIITWDGVFERSTKYTVPRDSSKGLGHEVN